MFDSKLDLTGLSPRVRRLVVLGIRGGDGDTPLPLDALLQRVDGMADLTDDDLETLEADLRAAGVSVLEEPSQEALEQADQILTAVDSVVAARATREEQAAEIAAGADERLARLRGETGDGAEGEGEGDAGDGGDGGDGGDAGDGADGGDGGDGGDAAGEGDGGADGGDAGSEAEEAERIAAAAGANDGGIPRVGRVAARRPNVVRPRPRHADRQYRLVASANTPGVAAGTVLESPESIANAFEHAIRASQGYRGPRVEMPIMSIGSFDPAEIYGASRTLGRDAIHNEELIHAVTSGPALRASGGICAPVPVQYDLPIIGTDDRPVRDALARFGVPRGGIRLLPPPQLTDVVGAVGAWTEANDVDPGSDGPEAKPCLILDCPEEVETLVAAITQCLRIGNFRARFFPEQVQAWTTLVGVQAARFAETRALQKIGDLSTQVGVSQVLGTTRTVLAAMDRAGAALRSHQRLSPDFPLRLLAPAWLLDNMISDLSREMPGATAERLATSDAQIQAFFASRQINVTWFLDGEAGQIFGPQLDGELTGWPSSVITYLYIEGTWLHLDAGMLDFGIVRDSTLNSTNDFQIFSEVFEEVAFHGVDGTSLRLDIDICPSGETAATSDTSTLCVSGS